MLGRDPPGLLLELQTGEGRPSRVVSLVAEPVEGHHEGVTDDAVDLTAVPLGHGGDRDVEVLVEHLGHLGRGVALGVAGETLEVGKQDAHDAATGYGRLAVQPGEALFVPGLLRAPGHQDEGCEQEQVPLPPADEPVRRYRDRDHRLREEHEGSAHGSGKQAAAPPPQPEVEQGRAEVEPGGTDGGDEHGTAGPLRTDALVEGRQPPQRESGPDRHEHEEADAQASGRCAALRAFRSGGTSTTEAAAKTEPRMIPTGVEMLKPALAVGSSTWGVASACRARKPAADRNVRRRT